MSQSSRKRAPSPASDVHRIARRPRSTTDKKAPIGDDGGEYDVAQCRNLLDNLSELTGNELAKRLTSVVTFSQQAARASWAEDNKPNWWREGDTAYASKMEGLMESFRYVKKMSMDGQRAALAMFCMSRIFFEANVRHSINRRELEDVEHGKNPYPPRHYANYFSEIDSLKSSLQNVHSLSEKLLRKTLEIAIRHSQRTKQALWDAEFAPNWWCHGEIIKCQGVHAKIEAFGPVEDLSLDCARAALVVFYQSRLYYEIHLKRCLSDPDLESIAKGKNPFPPKYYEGLTSQHTIVDVAAPAKQASTEFDVDECRKLLEKARRMSLFELRGSIRKVVRYSQERPFPSWKPENRPNWWSEGTAVEEVNATVGPFITASKAVKEDLCAALAMFCLSKMHFEINLKGRLSQRDLKSVTNGKNPYSPKQWDSEHSTEESI